MQQEDGPVALHESRLARLETYCAETRARRNRHRADGRLSGDEDAAEADDLAAIHAEVGALLEVQGIARALEWSGTEGFRAKRLLRDAGFRRVERPGNVVPMRDEHGPEAA
jgi:hypothetical protein